MKLKEYESILDELNSIKLISDTQNYNISSSINKHLINIIPLIKNEIDRLSTEKVEVDHPYIFIVGVNQIKESNESISNFINNKLEELVIKGYKIIDFGIMPGEYSSELLAYIKYTN